MRDDTSGLTEQSGTQLQKIAATSAGFMFVAFIACWLLGVDRTVTLALGAVAVLDALMVLILHLVTRRASAPRQG